MAFSIGHALLGIAKRHLGISTLETRGNDSMDFHDVSVSGINKALIDAYWLGFEQAKKQTQKMG